MNKMVGITDLEDPSHKFALAGELPISPGLYTQLA